MARRRLLLLLAVGAAASCRHGSDGTPAGSMGPRGPLEGLQLSLEPVGGRPGELPPGLRLIARNLSGHRIEFQPPGPLCPNVPGGFVVPPVSLGMVFRDGLRESDLSFGPAFADLEARSAPDMRGVTIPRGGSWSREYETRSFHFFGPCGPAANVPTLIGRGNHTIELSLVLFIGQHSRVETSSLTFKGEVPPELLPRRRAARH